MWFRFHLGEWRPDLHAWALIFGKLCKPNRQSSSENFNLQLRLCQYYMISPSNLDETSLKCGSAFVAYARPIACGSRHKAKSLPVFIQAQNSLPDLKSAQLHTIEKLQENAQLAKRMKTLCWWCRNEFSRETYKNQIIRLCHPTFPQQGYFRTKISPYLSPS